MKTKRRTFKLAGVLLGGALAGGVAVPSIVASRAVAQSEAPSSSTGATTQMSGTITKIDKKKHKVTIKSDETGDKVTVQAPSDMQGADQLKVGDKVDATYHEAVALSFVPPGQATPPPSVTEEQGPGGGGTPSGAAVRQMSATVKVTSVDHSTNKVTFRTPDGETESVTVQDPALQQTVAKLKAGDRVQVTYTEALAASITPKK